jgi:hypothetical protein
VLASYRRTTVKIRGAAWIVLTTIVPVTCHAAAQLGFGHDIAPIIYTNCSPCHRPGEAAPFTLLSYEDVKAHAPLIAVAVGSRRMPPWLPDPAYGHYIDEDRLTDAQIRMVLDWIKEGAPQGPTSEIPAPPSFIPGWQLGQPDMILEADRAISVPASGPDVFWNFIFHPDIKSTRYIRAMEIRPGDRHAVHHANLLVDRTGWSLRQETAPGQGFPGMDIINERSIDEPDDGHFLFWKPGSRPYVEPDGLAWQLDPGNRLVLNTHVHLMGMAMQVKPTIGLYFTDKPPDRHPMLVELEHDGALDIPPGNGDFLISDDFRIPLDADVLAVYPHAHYLGKLLEGYATLPDGTRKWLIRIPNWDPNWQGVYHYPEPVFLPKDSVISIRYHYDNTDANPRNPNRPPKRVVGGDMSTDEMGHLWLQVLPRGGDRRRELDEAVTRHRLEKYPNDLPAHLTLGALMLARLSPAEAVPMAQAAIRIAPNNAEARNLLGAALNAAGRTTEAIEQFQVALRLRPDFVNARFNLGSALVNAGRLDEAVRNFRNTTASAASSAGMQYNTAGCALHVDSSKFNRPGLTELSWQSDILEYSYVPAGSNPFALRLDSMFVGFMGRGFGPNHPYPFLVVAAAIQNVGHSFRDDAVENPKPFPGVGIYLSSLQTTLLDSQHGVRLNANTTGFPGYGRNFVNVNGLGYSGKNIYSRQNVGSPSPEKPISVKWTIRKMETLTNPPQDLSRSIDGKWIPLSGTFVRWNFEIAINGAATNVADYYLPVERAEYIRSDDPLALVPEHFGSANQMLRSQKSALRIGDAWVSDGARRYPLTDWTLTSCIDDGAGNADPRYGWRSDGASLTDSVGQENDATSSMRVIGTRFTLTAPGVSSVAR